MVKLTLRPGEFIDISENVRVIFSGGSAKIKNIYQRDGL